MKKFYFCLLSLVLLTVWSVFSFQASAQDDTAQSPEIVAASPNFVISGFQVAGGTQTDEFIELHNISANSADLNGYRVVYRSAAGTSDVAMVEWTAATVIPAGGYYLIATGTYDGTPASNINYNTSTVSMSASGGGLAIRSGALNAGVIVDSVAYGSATNAFVEAAVTTAPTANSGQMRLNNGCQDTDNNANDFSNVNPSAPRNAASAVNVCGGATGSGLLANGGASPSTVSPGATTLLTVTVLPASSPASTGITVVGNLTNIGGAASQPFFDDGTNGDVTANDNVFSYSAVIPSNAAGGTVGISATASDAQARSATVSFSININAPLPNENPILFGNPSGATTDVANENNYLMVKPQYTMAYNRSKATTNWTAWRLDSSWIGSAARQNDFRPDDTLPAAWYHVTDTDYSGSGYDRGHMCPSGDRTNSITNNSATFLMTNMVPQLSANNQGPWEEFESYSRTLAGQGNEIYIISGPSGNIGTIAGGKIVVPKVTWKVVLILPNGSNDLKRVNRATRAFGIIVPNQPPLDINAPWRNFRTTVDAVEALTGYNFNSEIPKITQELIERKRDNQ